MRILRVVFLGLVATASICCKAPIEDKDMVGVWTVDPAAVSGKPDNDVMSKMSFNLTPDHQYVMSGPVPIAVKGTWGFFEKKLTVAPTNISIQNPMEPGKTMDVPVNALAQMQSMTPDPKVKEALGMMGDAMTFDVSNDGKKLSTAGKPALIKSS